MNNNEHFRRIQIQTVAWGCLVWACTLQRGIWGRSSLNTAPCQMSLLCTTSSQGGPGVSLSFTLRTKMTLKRYESMYWPLSKHFLECFPGLIYVLCPLSGKGTSQWNGTGWSQDQGGLLHHKKTPHSNPWDLHGPAYIVSHVKQAVCNPPKHQVFGWITIIRYVKQTSSSIYKIWSEIGYPTHTLWLSATEMHCGHQLYYKVKHNTKCIILKVDSLELCPWVINQFSIFKICFNSSNSWIDQEEL